MGKILFALLLFAFPLFSQEKGGKEEKRALMLYYSPECPHCRSVLNWLDAHGRKIPMKNVVNNSQAKKELVQLGGKAEIPCLFVDKTPIYRSGPIIDWLEEHPN